MTPVYGVLTYSVRDGVISTNIMWNTPESRDRHGISHQVPLSEKQARDKVDELQAKGWPAKAYHFGWKERGFRVGERACTELCRNERWDHYQKAGLI